MTHDPSASAGAEMSRLVSIRFIEVALERLLDEGAKLGLEISEFDRRSSDALDFGLLDQLDAQIDKNFRVAESVFLKLEALQKQISSTELA